MDTKCMMSSGHRHKLALQPALMTMETYISETRSWRLPIPFLDFLVDGESPIEGVLGKGSDRLLRDFNLSGSTSAWTNRSIAC
jgi:hypothetical protein